MAYKRKGDYARHGRSGTPIYKVWEGMIERCEKPNHISYPRYGGRGITVCKRWRNSFAQFFADMGDIPFEGAQLDRRDNDGNYCPNNCRWVTRSQNMLNTSKQS